MRAYFCEKIAAVLLVLLTLAGCLVSASLKTWKNSDRTVVFAFTEPKLIEICATGGFTENYGEISAFFANISGMDERLYLNKTSDPPFFLNSLKFELIPTKG